MNQLGTLAAGAVLGRYELVLRVNSGGMGEVWAARIKGSRGFQKVIALKTLLPELSHNPNFEQMFLDEAALAARIKHPNVVQVIDLGEENDVLFQVMEWVSGESLWGLMRAAAKRGGIPLEIAARITCQVCAGLHAAHELKDDRGQPIGLVHRDISPQNILLTTQGIAKVVDFGVAKFAGRGVAATQVGELRGKAPYMAPEHIRGQKLDRRADVFALGILFYQLVSGEHPFLADTDQLTMARISSPTPALPLKKKKPSVPDELSRVVAAALEKSPEKRTATALELMQQIERVIPDAGHASANDRVAAFLKEVSGATIEERDAELREALRAIDGRASMLPPGREAALPPGQATGSPSPQATPPGQRISSNPEGPRWPASAPMQPGSGDASISVEPGGPAEDEKSPALGASGTWFERNRGLAVAAAIAVLAGAVVGVAGRSSSASVAFIPRVSAAPAVVVAAVRSALSTSEASSSDATTPQAPASATPRAAGPAGTNAGSPAGAPSASTRPSSPPPATTTTSTKKGNGPRREFVPGGI